jgi:serine/threonine-protein kinase
MIYGEIGGGGMATVHLGRLMGASGFSRTVAIKRLYPQYARDPVFASMFLDEARLASRVHHPNVVSTLDVVNEDGELLLVMEYVHGETLGHLVGAAEALGLTPSPAIVCAIITGALYGLHAAHTATSESGEPLGMVHRDISPQNIMVGADGVARVLDFGVAKASMRSQTTSQGQIKGKLAYMAPEQLRGGEIDQRTDIFATGVVLWEALTGRRLFKHDDVGQLVRHVLKGKIPPPSHCDERLPRELDRIVMRALARSPGARYRTANNFATALERAILPASPREVGAWVSQVAAETLTERSNKLAEVETSSARLVAREDLESSAAQSGPVPTARRAVREAVADAAAPAPVARAPRRRWRFAVAAVLGVVAMAAAAVLVTLGNEPPPAPASPSQGAVVEPSAVAKAQPASPQPAAAEEPPASSVLVTGDSAEPPSATPDPPKPAAASAPPAPKKVWRARPAPRARSAPRRRSAAKPSCNPPYRIDEDGIRRIRPECLR